MHPFKNFWTLFFSMRCFTEFLTRHAFRVCAQVLVAIARLCSIAFTRNNVIGRPVSRQPVQFLLHLRSDDILTSNC